MLCTDTEGLVDDVVASLDLRRLQHLVGVRARVRVGARVGARVLARVRAVAVARARARARVRIFDGFSTSGVICNLGAGAGAPGSGEGWG